MTLDEFWGAGQAIAGERQVPARFTSKGKQAIDEYYKEIEEAWPEAPLLAKNKSEFDARYRALSFEAWKAFADGFAGGTARLKSPKDVQQAATRMAQDGGPYFALLNKITMELEPLATGGPLPAWLAQVLQFQLIRAQGLVQEERRAEQGRRERQAAAGHGGAEARPRRGGQEGRTADGGRPGLRHLQDVACGHRAGGGLAQPGLPADLAGLRRGPRHEQVALLHGVRGPGEAEERNRRRESARRDRGATALRAAGFSLGISSAGKRQATWRASGTSRCWRPSRG